MHLQIVVIILLLLAVKMFQGTVTKTVNVQVKRILQSHRNFSNRKLSHDVHNANEGVSADSVLFLHGILGSKKNWRTPSHEFIKLHKNFQAVTIDHRGHGSSPKINSGLNNVAACADDIVAMFQTELAHIPPPKVICAHSFSGKVALMYLKKLVDSNINQHVPEHTWILDSIPGLYDKSVDTSQQQSVTNIIELLARLPIEFESKDWMIKHLVAQGIPLSVAMWLCMNVVPVDPLGGGGSSAGGKGLFKFSFDMETIAELFADYCQLDLWDFLQTYDGSRGTIQFIRAGKNKNWTPEVLSRFDEVTRRNPNVRLHTMPHVGHWLHSDDLPGMLDIISKNSR